MLKRIREIDDRYVTAEEAARRLGVCMSTVYQYLALPRGDWHLVNGKWVINLESLMRRRAEDEEWRERYRATHVAVPVEPSVPVETRAEPDWEAMPEWIGVSVAMAVIGLTRAAISYLALRGMLPRKEEPGREPTGIMHGPGPRSARRRWVYLREGVRRYWHRQERAARDRALRGECIRDWGPRDARNVPPYWRDQVDRNTAAAMLGVSGWTVSHLCATGMLPAYQKRPGKRGSPLRIPRAAVERLAMRPGRSYWREINAIRPEPPEPGEEFLRRPVQMRLDAERRNAAHRKRLEIGEFHGYDTEEAARIRDGESKPEEGKTVQLGFGYTEWYPVNNEYRSMECWPMRREFGEREVNHGDFYSTSQVARLLGVCRTRVHYLRTCGRLQGYRLKKHRREGGRGPWWWFFRKDDVEELVARVEDERRKRRRKRDGEG